MPVTIFTSAAVILRILSNPFSNVFQKMFTSKGQHPLSVNFLTYLGLSIFCFVYALQISWKLLPAAFWSYSILSAIVGTLGNAFLIQALQKGDLSVLGPINAYKSVVGLFVGFFLLQEIPSVGGIIGMGCIILGSYFVLDTTEERFSWSLLKKKEIQYRIWAMILTAIEAVLVKKIILVSSPTISFLSWCFSGAFFSLLLLFFNKARISTEIHRLSLKDYFRYLYLIACVGITQLATIFVFDRMDVGYALALFQLSAIVSIFLGYHFFKEKDLYKKLIGAAIMVAGSAIIILMK